MKVSIPLQILTLYVSWGLIVWATPLPLPNPSDPVSVHSLTSHNGIDGARSQRTKKHCAREKIVTLRNTLVPLHHQGMKVVYQNAWEKWSHDSQNIDPVYHLDNYQRKVEEWPKEIQDCFHLMDGAQDLEDRMKNAYDLLFLQWEYLYTIHFGERSLLIHHADTCRYVEQMYRHHIQVVGADFDTTIGQGFGEHSKDVLLQLHRSLPHSKRLAERLGQGEEVHSLTRPMIMICKDKVSRCAKLIQLQNLELVAEKCRDVHRRVKAFLKAHSNDIYPCQEMLDLEGAVKELESANAIKQLVPSSAHTTVVPIRDIAMPDSNEFYPDCVGSSKCSVM